MTSSWIISVSSSGIEYNISIRAPSFPYSPVKDWILLISNVPLNAWVEGMKYLLVKDIVFVSLEPLTFISKVALVFSFNLIAKGTSISGKLSWYLSTFSDKNRIAGLIGVNVIFSGSELYK